MCVSISIENVVSHYFMSNKNKKLVSLTELSRYNKKIERRFIEDKKDIVFIDYTYSDLYRMLRANSDIFELKDDHILVHDINILRKEMPFFDSKLPRSIKKHYLEIFKQVNEELN